MHNFWIVRHRPWARPAGHRWTPELATKPPSSEALRLMETHPPELRESLLTQFPNELGDLTWMQWKLGAALMEGMKFTKGPHCLYFYPEAQELRERFAALEKDAKFPLDEVRRFVGLYEAAYQERTEWVQVTETVDDPEDEANDDGTADCGTEEPEEGAEPLGVEVDWGDAELMRRQTRPVPGEFHREPVIILHP